MADKGIGWIIAIILIIAGLFYFFGEGEIQSVIPDMETQLRSEYITYWGDSTDGQGQDKFDCETTISSGATSPSIPGTGTDSLTIAVGQGETKKCISKQNFRGQEVVVLMSGSGTDIYSTVSRGIIGSCSWLPSCVRSGTTIDCPQAITKFVPHTFDTSIYDVYQDGVIISEMNVGDNFYFPTTCAGSGLRGISFTGKIDFVGYKAEFSCDLTEDEVWIQEQFAEPFDISDLEFMPTKFCHETRPFVLRRLEEGEKPIRKEEGIQVINTGGTLPASSSDLITVNYATFFVEGVNNKCQPNQANVKVGGKWVCQDFIKPLTIIVQCEEHSDCPQPLKNLCPDFFQGCQNNFCVYNQEALNLPICQNEVVTIVKEIEKIQERELIVVTGANIFPFGVNYPSNSFNFGEEEFKANIDFTCSIPEGEIITFPNPNPDCYTGEASFEGQSFDLKDGDIFKIRDNIEVTYFAGGRVISRDIEFDTKKGLSSTFIFEIIGNPMDIELKGGSEVLKDSNKTLSFTIKNNLPKGNLLLKITSIAKRNNEILPEIRFEKSIQEGSNEISFDMGTSHFGINEFTVQTFYKITVNDKEVLLPSDKIRFNMNVVQELSGLEPEIVVITERVTEEKIVYVEVPTEKEIPTIVLIIGGLMGLFLLLKLFDVI